MIGMLTTIFLCLIALVIFILGQNKEEIWFEIYKRMKL